MEVGDIIVVSACVEDLHQRPVHRVLQVLEQGSALIRGGCQQGLDAILGHIAVRVLLHFAEYDVQQGRHRVDAVAGALQLEWRGRA